jgi:hypothetical protein
MGDALKTTNDKEWGWYVEGSTGHGPFASKDAAIDHAKGYLDEESTVIVGPITYLTAEACLPNLDALIELMEESAWDQFGCEERMFDHDPEAAGEALRAVLNTWADDHLEYSRWFRIDYSDALVVTPDVVDDQEV